VQPRIDPDPNREGQPVISTCPECGGVLSEHHEAGVTQWRCRVGHRYSPESLADAQAEGVEAALWGAVRALEDREMLLRRMAGQLEAKGSPRSAASFRSRAREARAQSEAVRATLGETAAATLQRVSDSEAVEAERRGAA
jgi:two-component system chemotaxis response regulator CheB